RRETLRLREDDGGGQGSLDPDNRRTEGLPCRLQEGLFVEEVSRQARPRQGDFAPREDSQQQDGEIERGTKRPREGDARAEGREYAHPEGISDLPQLCETSSGLGR